MVRNARVFATLEKFAVFPSKQFYSEVCGRNFPVKDVKNLKNQKVLKWQWKEQQLRVRVSHRHHGIA